MKQFTCPFGKNGFLVCGMGTLFALSRVVSIRPITYTLDVLLMPFD